MNEKNYLLGISIIYMYIIRITQGYLHVELLHVEFNFSGSVICIVNQSIDCTQSTNESISQSAVNQCINQSVSQ